MKNIGERSVIIDTLSIYVPTFFIMTGLSIVSPILSIYAKSFGISYSLATLIISIYAIVRMFADIPVGMLGDRFGRRPILLLGVLIITFSSVFCAHARNFLELMFYRAIQGLGSSMWQISRATLLQDVLKPEERGRILGYFQSFILIGSTAGPSIGGVVAEKWGIRAPFYAYALGGLISLLLSYFFIREAEVYKNRRSQMVPNFSFELLKKLLRNLSFNAACISVLTISLLRQGLRSTLIPLYGDAELNLSKAEIGYAMSFSNFVNLFLTIPIGHALDKFGRKVVLVPSLLAAGILSAFFPFTRGFTDVSLMCILLGISDSGGSQAPLALASDATMDEPHGISMGLFRVFHDIGFVAGPTIVGVTADAYGLRFPFYVLSVIVFASAVVVQFFAKETLKKG